MAEILAFPRPAVGARRDLDIAKDDPPAVRLRSALDGVGKTLADLLLALLAELEDSSLRLSLIIERAAGEVDKRLLRAEQQDIHRDDCRAEEGDRRRGKGFQPRLILGRRDVPRAKKSAQRATAFDVKHLAGRVVAAHQVEIGLRRLGRFARPRQQLAPGHVGKLHFALVIGNTVPDAGAD
jgi:hypothetical protein